MKTHARCFFSNLSHFVIRKGPVVVAVLFILFCVTSRYTLAINCTASLPETLFVLDKKAYQDGAPQAGDYVAFRWPVTDSPIPVGIGVIKKVVGVAGEVLTSHPQENGATQLCVKGQPVALAKPTSRQGAPLKATPAQTIPAGTLFVTGEHPDSLDSRYALLGPIAMDTVYARAYPLF